MRVCYEVMMIRATTYHAMLRVDATRCRCFHFRVEQKTTSHYTLAVIAIFRYAMIRYE